MKKLLLVSIVVFTAILSTAISEWTTLSLPNTTNWDKTTIGHLSDGRFIYGQSGALVQQDTFGSSAVSSYANAPTGDYSFVTSHFLGIGGFSPQPVYSFSGGNLAHPQKVCLQRGNRVDADGWRAHF